MATLTAPITVGTASANTAHEADLGKRVILGGKTYVVCKAAATIATVAKKVLISAVSSGQPTWSVNLAGASTAYIQKHRVAVPAGQVGSTGTTSLISGDYFLAQISGPCQLLANAAITAGGSLFLVAMSTGKVKASTLTTAIAARASIGFGTHTANASAADVTIGAMLCGLV